LLIFSLAVRIRLTPTNTHAFQSSSREMNPVVLASRDLHQFAEKPINSGGEMRETKSTRSHPLLMVVRYMAVILS